MCLALRVIFLLQPRSPIDNSKNPAMRTRGAVDLERRREKKKDMQENREQTGTWLLVLFARPTVFLRALCVSAVNLSLFAVKAC
jgi:hypothetical protein